MDLLDYRSKCPLLEKSWSHRMWLVNFLISGIFDGGLVDRKGSFVSG